MTEEQLRERVYSLSERFPWLGMTSDIASMTKCELEGAYALLSRLRHYG